MPVGLTFSVNLNDLFKDILSQFKDACDQHEDLRAYEKTFKRLMKRSELLQTILGNQDLISDTVFANMSEYQREGLLAEIHDAEEYWQQFSRVLDRYGATSKFASKVLKPARWISRDKEKVEVILERLERVNRDIKEEIDLIFAWFTKKSPSFTQGVERDADAQATGLSRSLALRRTWRSTTTFNRKLLQDSALVNPPFVESPVQPEPLVRKAVYAQRRNVIVEHRYYTSHDTSVEYDALQLATFLSLEKPDEMKVLPCIATYHHRQSSSYGFVFDLRPLAVENHLVADNSRTPLQSAIPTFTNLKMQLSRSTDHALFRYSKFGGDASFPLSPVKYLSLSERLKFASSLVETVYQVLFVEWVHQDIRSNNIWFTIEDKLPGQNQVAKERLPRTPYLFNFEFARPSDKYSNPRLVQRDDDLVNLTRHPSRQFGHFLVPHGKIHDIYALGIVLLEIGLGRPIGELFSLFKNISLADQAPEEAETILPQPVLVEAERKRRQIVAGAAMLLPERMGDRYAAIVARCLSGNLLDEDTAGVDSEDANLLREFRRVVIDQLKSLAEISQKRS